MNNNNNKKKRGRGRPRKRKNINRDNAAAQQQPPPARSTPPLNLATAETCAIHGKALEERALFDEAFPLLVDALRLIWDIMKGENGRVEEYRLIWVEDCQLNPMQFERALAQARAVLVVSGCA